MRPQIPERIPKNHRPIFLLRVPHKIVEKLIHICVEPVVDPLLPDEQAVFRLGRLTVYQAVLLTQNIENCFEAKRKADALFAVLTAAYETSKDSQAVACQAHDANNHEACSKQELYRHHR